MTRLTLLPLIALNIFQLCSGGTIQKTIHFNDYAELAINKCIIPGQQPSQTCPPVYDSKNGLLGNFTSPGFYNNTIGHKTYGNFMCCQGQMYVNGHFIKITFTSFNIEQGYDFLSIYDGNTTSDSTKILANFTGAYDGQTFPVIYGSKDTPVTYVFRTDASGDTGHFSANWISTDVICGPPIYTAQNGTITSPNWSPNQGGRYPNKIKCGNIILAPNPANVITLSFDPNSSTEPTYDYVRVLDAKDNQLAMLSGPKNSPVWKTPITASGQVTIEFDTDNTITGKGFSLFYTITRTGACECGNPLPLPAIKGSPTQSIRNLTSPGFPTLPYCNSLTCTWYLTIQADPGDTVKVYFQGFSLGTGDSVVIYDGYNGPDRQTCVGNSCPAVIGNEVAATVKLFTDNQGVGPGFRVFWTIHQN